MKYRLGVARSISVTFFIYTIKRWNENPNQIRHFYCKWVVFNHGMKIFLVTICSNFVYQSASLISVFDSIRSVTDFFLLVSVSKHFQKTITFIFHGSGESWRIKQDPHGIECLHLRRHFCLIQFFSQTLLFVSLSPVYHCVHAMLFSTYKCVNFTYKMKMIVWSDCWK